MTARICKIVFPTRYLPETCAEARLKQAEASSKELEVACTQHAKSIESLQTAKADAVTKMLLQQEADFQAFCRDMNGAMQGFWRVDRDSAMLCQRALATTEKASRKRRDCLLLCFNDLAWKEFLEAATGASV